MSKKNVSKYPSRVVCIGIIIVLAIALISWTICYFSKQIDPVLLVGGWELVSLRDQDLIEGSFITLRFHSHKFLGWTTCNRYGAAFDYFKKGVADWKKKIDTTDLACANPDLMTQEELYLEALSNVVAYRVSLVELDLFDQSGKTILIYRRRWIPQMLE